LTFVELGIGCESLSEGLKALCKKIRSREGEAWGFRSLEDVDQSAKLPPICGGLSVW
jgi:hypothetical protein